MHACTCISIFLHTQQQHYIYLKTSLFHKHKNTRTCVYRCRLVDVVKLYTHQFDDLTMPALLSCETERHEELQ